MATTGDILDGLVIGLHLISAHSAQGMNDSNIGIYARTSGGATMGVFENSISGTELNGNNGRRRTSTYLGWTWETPGQTLGLTLGAVNGYGRAAQWTCPQSSGMAAGRSKGHGPTLPPPSTPSAGDCDSPTFRPAVREILPLAVVSGRMPLGAGWAARLGYLYVPSGTVSATHTHVANLMIERHF